MEVMALAALCASEIHMQLQRSVFHQQRLQSKHTQLHMYWFSLLHVDCSQDGDG